GARDPDPAVRGNEGPASIMKGSPAPLLLRAPCLAVIGVYPAPCRIGAPCRGHIMRHPHLAVFWQRDPRAVGRQWPIKDTHIRDAFWWLLIDRRVSGVSGVLRQAWYGGAPSPQTRTAREERGEE